MEQQNQDQLNPSKIMQIGMGFWASKVVLSAVKFKVFTLLAGTQKSAKEIKEALKLGCTDRHVFDFLDTLLSLGFLKREGLLENAKYSNAPDAEFFLDEKKPSFMGGILKMANNRLFHHWQNLEEGLLTGEPQNEAKQEHNMEFFHHLYQSPEALQEFMDAMSGIQGGNFMTLVKKFNFSNYKTLTDVGGADGFLSAMITMHHPDIVCTTFDLPPVAAVVERKLNRMKITSRVKIASGDFMKDPIPPAEIITMGNILHGVNEETKLMLFKKVFDVLPDNGVFMAIENIIDNDRSKNTFGLLMSLNMLIENGDAFDYTANDFENWAKQTGFKRVEIIPLAGPTSAAIAYKK
jgi:hypothetical protein